MAKGPRRAPETADLAKQAAALGPWFHNLHLPGGVRTAPDHPLGDFPSFKWRALAGHIPEDLRGWQALDIGCNGGYYSFELARRGARVTAIDVDPRYLDQARWAAAVYGLEDGIQFRRMQVYDLAHTDETYDLVLFMGVFYHLRYPLLALDIVARKVERLAVFQTLEMPGDDILEPAIDYSLDDRAVMRDPGWPRMAFIEHRLAGDPTNWWAPNRACVEALIRSTGLRVVARPEHEVYLCAPNPTRPSCVDTWNAHELRAATGRPWLPRVEDD